MSALVLVERWGVGGDVDGFFDASLEPSVFFIKHTRPVCMYVFWDIFLRHTDCQIDMQSDS